MKGEKVFRRMLELDTIRGPHSTGILHVNGKGETNVFKQVGTPWDLYQYKACEDLFRPTANVLLGHNRWATKGKVNRANAHPFEFDSVVGAHNGTLTSTFNLDDHAKFEVDSENIYHDMDKNGVYETIPKLKGAYALTWFNKHEMTINLIRNEQRPLYYAFSKNMETLFWASEPWMIELSVRGEYEIESVVSLPINTLHSFEVPMGYPIKKFDKVRIRKLEGFKEEKKPTVFQKGSLTGTPSNIVPFEKKETPVVGKTKRSAVEYLKFVGRSCIFYVGKVETSNSGQAFIQCWSVDDDDIQLRVFPTAGGELWKKMLESQNYFRGVAKHYNGQEGGYLTVDIRTVEETEINCCDVPPDDEEKLFFVGYEGEALTEDEWLDRTNKDCAWCSSPAAIEDHEEIVWISKNEFVCSDCAVQPEVTQYLSQAEK